MAARLRPRHQDEIRTKIKVAQIINFLETYVETGKDTGGQDVNPARIQAARILLDKTMPSMQAIEHTGEIETHYVAVMPEAPADHEEWAKRFAPPATLN